jgi:sialic acid synthase SpsE
MSHIFPSLRQIFGLQVGLADHIDGDSHLAMIVPLLGIPLGATIIEKHITHNRQLKGVDYESALNPDEFKKLVQDWGQPRTVGALEVAILE